MDENPEYTFKDSSVPIISGQPISFAVDEYDCPVCGVVKVYVSVSLGDPALDGMYCQKCYAVWINKNLPRLTKRNRKI